MQVANDIVQIQLPLPFPLKIVNCYALRDGTGWTIVDTGIHYPPGEAAWRAAFAAHGIDPADIARIVLTHADPDHCGMAGWLAEIGGAPVLLAPGEAAFAQQVWFDGETNERTSTAFFRAHGMPAELADQLRASMAENRSMTPPLPRALTPLEPGSTLQIGARVFEAIATPGHSREHLVFYCADERLMLCGDAVLNKITPNVSRWPDGHLNPLADFLDSLARLGELDVDLALPGHGPLITTFRQRLGELRQHHDERLDAIEAAAGDGATAFAVCQEIFPTSALSPHQLRFAIAETLAHLEYLAFAGRVERLEQPQLMYRRMQ
ncbi:beta-lactamase [Kouleothrix aurantiaca]|uniref:Beta-lactamase n=1 Tax=Kouleothrix aurantiaca TaxID=186479 RepID=A0A0P9DAW4_9CHLR|nr:beta-lactamase [Kouleothrix aurantiaca]